MTRYAVLCGSAPDGFTQKKINDMHDFLTSSDGGGWKENEIMIFPNGTDEAMLSFVLERLASAETESILLYVCTLSPVKDDDESVWLGGEQIQKTLFEGKNIQTVYDTCREFVSEEEYGYERVAE